MSKLVFVFVVALSGSGCISLSTYQTARTLKPNEFSLALGGGTQTVKYSSTESSVGANGETTETEEIRDAKVILLEAGLRYGFAPRFDGGVKLSLGGGSQVDVKYMLTDGSGKTAHSLGLAYGSVEYSSTTSSTPPTENGAGDPVEPIKEKTTYRMEDYMLPYYFSYELHRDIDITLSPRYVYRKVEINDVTVLGSQNKTGSMIGMVAGLRISGFILEAGGLTAVNGDKNSAVYQVTLGFFTGWDKLDRGETSEASVTKRKKKNRKLKRDVVQEE